jgi:flavin reductase (DIM6/NTAB) family NADH-FMN oxidoreductase RutF
MKAFRKKSFPPSKIRRYLEPGPIVLVSSAWKRKQNIMTMGWHMVMEFSPSLIGCYIWDENHSFEMIRKSKECVINIPTYDILDKIIGIGNCSGDKIDKFKKFKLTPLAAEKVKAPLIKECYANFECKLYDGSQISKRGLFIFEVVKAHAAAAPKYPKTVHYRGEGIFMISGPSIDKSKKFKRQNL